MEDNKIEVIEKETGKYIIIDIDKAIKEQEKFIFLNGPYYQTLYEIWDKYKKPFIAENSYGAFVLIYKDPYYHNEKYEGNIYGRLSKSIKNLILYDKSQRIYFAWQKEWRFIALYE